MTTSISSGPTIIAFASPKGGVGKSTSCACLAGALAAKGHAVVILDLDQNRTLDQWARRFPEQLRSIRVEAIGEGALIDRIQALYATFEGFILIDVAGALHMTTIAAATVAHLTITPAKLSAPDIIEAVKLNREIVRLGERVGKPIRHRLLLNEVSPLWPNYQRAALADVERSGLVPFRTYIQHRAPFGELFQTGQPPHFADRSREPVAKAIEQVEAWLAEVMAIVQPQAQAEAA